MGSVWRGRDTAVLTVLVLLGSVSLIVVFMAGPPGTQRFAAVNGASQALCSCLGLVFAVRAARLDTLPSRMRRAWRMMLPSYVLWPLMAVLYVPFPGQQFPNPPDVVRLLIGPATLIGILAFARLPTAPTERFKLWLDAGLVAVGAAMVLWYLVISPALAADGSTWHEHIPGVVNPLTGAALLFGVGVVLLRGPEVAAARNPLVVLVAATLLILVGDTQRAYILSHGGAAAPSTSQALLWTAGIFLLMVAPLVQTWRSGRPVGELGGTPRTVGPPMWPYLTVLPGYALLMVTTGLPQPFPAAGLITGTFLTSTLIIARQKVAAQQARRLAVTDALTRLPNRIQLHEMLPRALSTATRNGTHVGILIIDMNGFKQVNDTLGHRAGDQLLVGFSRQLRRCVRVSDLVARLGGDEFVIVLPALTCAGQARAVACRIDAAMAESIDVGAALVKPSASIGMALSRPSELSADDLLNRADLDMYEKKRHRNHATFAVANSTGSPPENLNRGPSSLIVEGDEDTPPAPLRINAAGHRW